jgi:Zn-dependent peptidase ImmA (M78 family)/transcriptional regulator with XRE-family HTH domain
MVIGERIKAARMNAGLSQQVLAERMGLSKMAISKYETGAVVPKSGVLITLSKAMGVEVEYFFRTTSVKISKPEYRCRKGLAVKEEAKILGKTSDWLERYLTVEEITGASRPLALPSRENYLVTTVDEIEEMAIQLRAEWNLGLDPIENVMDVLEQRGIKVGIIEASDKFDALTLWYDNEHPVIIVNKRFSGDRQRFSLAHELGHLILSITGDIDEENAAYRFAGAFLVPRSMAYLELGERRHMLDFRELYVLKHKYGMSMGAWIRRAKDLGIITESAAKRHWMQIRAQGWHKLEPWKQVPAEFPTQMKLLLFRAMSEHKISQSRFAELLGDEDVKAAEPCT